MITEYDSPVAALPPELLSNIFVLSMTQAVAHDERSIQPIYPLLLDKTNSPVVLAQVSRRWREVALSTPEIWSRIALSLPPRAVSMGIQAEEQLKEAMIGCFESWLERSKTVPLYIDLNVNFHAPRTLYTDFLIPSLLSLLFHNAHRVRDLMITNTDITLGDLPVVPSGTTFSRLERLILRLPVGYSGWTASPTLFQSPNKLSHLSLPFDRIFSTNGLSWSQLTHLDIDDLSQPVHHIRYRFPRILAECNNLVTLRAHFSAPRFTLVQNASEPLPLLPRLQSLAVLGNLNIVALFIADLSSPQALVRLQTLVVGCKVDQPFSQVLFSFLRLHSETLRNLYMHGAPKPGLSPSAFFQICSSLPRLTTLSLNVSILSVPLVTALALRPSSFASSTPRTLEGGLNPFVSSFTMLPSDEQAVDIPLVGGTLVRGPYAATIESVAFMVQSRWRLPQSVIENGGAARLEEISMEKTQWDWMARNTPNAFARIKACVDEGLRLSFDVADAAWVHEFDWC